MAKNGRPSDERRRDNQMGKAAAAAAQSGRRGVCAVDDELRAPLSRLSDRRGRTRPTAAVVDSRAAQQVRPAYAKMEPNQC
jgi:hypothetical protein